MAEYSILIGVNGVVSKIYDGTKLIQFLTCRIWENASDYTFLKLSGQERRAKELYYINQ